MSKVFFLHTPPQLQIGGRCYGHRATIACTVENEQIKFGYAICSEGDNFSRAIGREKAIERMNKNFGTVAVKNGWFEHFHTPEAALMEFATTLSRSMRKNYEKYKRKLESFNSAAA